MFLGVLPVCCTVLMSLEPASPFSHTSYHMQILVHATRTYNVTTLDLYMRSYVQNEFILIK